MKVFGSFMKFFIQAENYYAYNFCEDNVDVDSDSFEVPNDLENAVNYFLGIVKKGYYIDFGYLKALLEMFCDDDIKELENGIFGAKLVLYAETDEDEYPIPFIENDQSYNFETRSLNNNKVVRFSDSGLNDEYKIIKCLIDKHNLG